MIVRAWQGWTTTGSADAYEKLLREDIFPDIQSKSIDGLRSIELLRLERSNETEFMTLLRFNSIDDIELIAGEDAELAYVPGQAKRVLQRYEKRARHFESRYEAIPACEPV